MTPPHRTSAFARQDARKCHEESSLINHVSQLLQAEQAVLGVAMEGSGETAHAYGETSGGCAFDRSADQELNRGLCGLVPRWSAACETPEPGGSQSGLTREFATPILLTSLTTMRFSFPRGDVWFSEFYGVDHKGSRNLSNPMFRAVIRPPFRQDLR